MFKLKNLGLWFLRSAQKPNTAQHQVIPEIIPTQNWRRVIQPTFVLQFEKVSNGFDLGYIPNEEGRFPARRKNRQVEKLSEETILFGQDMEENYRWNKVKKCWETV